ncbi:MAG: hypothetical protein AMJ43_05500 [Coxiella sp. DG_40]|nr:MAG: hypothetical protein AMJ43_05500 [Coxiella sp. DG_40]
MIIFLTTVFLVILILSLFMASSLSDQLDFSKRVTKVKNLIIKDTPSTMLIKLKGIKSLKKIDFSLSQAGFYSKTALLNFLSACLIFSVFIAAWCIFFARYEHFPFLIKVLLPIIGFILGLELPFFYVHLVARTRRKKIQQALPDVITVLSMYVDTGYSLNNALHSTAKDLRYYAPEISQEFSITANELDVTNNYHETWQALVKRVNLTELKTLVAALEQSYKYGVSLKNILRNLVSQFNRERMVKLEERGARLPIYMSIILIFCFLPIMFTIILTPLILRVVDVFKRMY